VKAAGKLSGNIHSLSGKSVWRMITF